MLVLSRGQGQTLVIDHGRITITVNRISNGKVRLAIDAPLHVAVDRGEVHKAKQAMRQGGVQ